MHQEKKLYSSRYPITLAAMNKASTLKLAVAAYKAGIFPSISGYNYYGNHTNYYGNKINLNVEAFKKDLISYADLTGSNNLSISIECLDSLRPEFLELCSLKLFTHVEIVDETKCISKADKSDDDTNLIKLEKIYSEIKSYGVSPIFKAIHPEHWTLKSERTRNIFPGAVIKSTDAAGLVNDDDTRKPLIEEFKELKNLSPSTVFVPTGGIYSSRQIKEYVNEGAEIVGVGSYFAIAEECEISIKTKQKIIESNSSQIEKFSDSGHNALMFRKISGDDMNHTKSLIAGTLSPLAGHIFMGKVIDHIKEIKPLKDLVEELVADLN